MKNNKPNPALLPTIDFETAGDVQRWTIFHKRESTSVLEYIVGALLGLVALTFAIALIQHLYMSATDTHSLTRLLGTLLPYTFLLVLSLVFLSVAFSLLYSNFRAARGQLKTIVELTPEQISCFDTGSGILGQRATIELSHITQLLVLDPPVSISERRRQIAIENANKKPEKLPSSYEAVLVARGPDCNQILVNGLDWMTTGVLAQQLSIEIEKTRHNVALVEFKNGNNKFLATPVELQFGEPAVNVQPVHSQLEVKRSGKSTTYSMKQKPNLMIAFGASILLALAATLSTAAILQFAFGEYPLLFIIWTIPMLMFLGAGLWCMGLAFEKLKFIASPGNLVIRHWFLFRGDVLQLSRSGIQSITPVERIKSLGDSDYMVRELAIRRANGESLIFPQPGSNVWDLHWLAHELNCVVMQNDSAVKMQAPLVTNRDL